jgi:hypothetical protein
MSSHPNANFSNYFGEYIIYKQRLIKRSIRESDISKIWFFRLKAFAKGARYFGKDVAPLEKTGSLPLRRKAFCIATIKQKY